MTGFIVTGTDTDVGKTVFAAALAGYLDGWYWKPVQAGLDGGTDAEKVAILSGLPRERILPETYRLTTPCSPHRAAQIVGEKIEPVEAALADRWHGRHPSTATRRCSASAVIALSCTMATRI